MKKLLMGLSLILLAQGFMSSDVNASLREDAKHDVQACLKDFDKHKEPKELISIFDQRVKTFDKNSPPFTYSNYA